MVKAGKRNPAATPKEQQERMSEACDPVTDDLDELISSLDGDEVVSRERKEGPGNGDGETLAPRSPGVPESPEASDAVPWLDRYDATNKLIVQLEDTLKMMEDRGVNLTQAWELANTARSLLDSADVAQALIFANRSFLMALDLHRFQEPSSGAAS